MLATPDALSEVLFGDHGVTTGTEPGTTLIDMSTVGPDHALKVAVRLPEGIGFVDAPVLGSVANAAAPCRSSSAPARSRSPAAGACWPRWAPRSTSGRPARGRR